MTKSAAVRNVNVDSDEPSQKATKKKVPSKRLRHWDESSGEEDEGLLSAKSSLKRRTMSGAT